MSASSFSLHVQARAPETGYLIATVCYYAQGDGDKAQQFKGPLPFGVQADDCLCSMVGTGQKLAPGWAFVNKSDGTKLHKAKCGNNEHCSWYCYNTVAGV